MLRSGTTVRFAVSIFLILAGTTSLAIIASAAAYDRVLQDSMEAQVEARLSAVANTQRHRVLDALSLYEERLALLTSRTQLRISTAAYLEDGNVSHVERAQRILNDARDATPGMRAIRIFGMEGDHVVATSSAGAWGQGERDAWAAGLNRTRVDLFYPREDLALGLRLAGPLVHEGRQLGVMVVDVDPAPFREIFEERIGLGGTGETILAMRDADGSARFISPLRFQSEEPLSVSVPADAANVPVIRVLGGEQGILRDATDYRGTTVAAVGVYLSEPDWALVTKIDQDEARAPVSQARVAAAALVVVGVVGATGLSWPLSRTLSRPLQRLKDGTKELEEGNLDHRITPEGMYGEFADVAQGMNAMAVAVATTRHELEQRVEERTSELARSNRDLEQFAGIASHDLREPLRMVHAYLDLIDRRYREKLDADGQEFLAFAVDGARRMEDLVQALLELSRLGGKPPSTAAVDLGGAIAEALDELAPKLREKNAQVDVPPDLPSVMGVRTELVRLARNLISNAIKYCEREPRVVVSARREDGRAIISFKDNGIGFEADQAERIFEPLKRLHGRQEYEGTGLGLAICQRIVERAGGTIRAEGRPGEGATFIVELAAAEDASSPATQDGADGQGQERDEDGSTG